MNRLVITKDGHLKTETTKQEHNKYYSTFGEAISDNASLEELAAYRLANLGQIFAFLLGLIAIIASTILALFDKNIMSAIILFATIAVLSTIAILSAKKEKKDIKNKKEQ